MSRVLYSDVHASLTLDEAAGIVRYTRTREPYPSLDVLRELHLKLRDVTAMLPRSVLSILVDVREAPPRNDPEFEREIVAALDGFMKPFRTHAALLKTVVGKLQVQRLSKGDDRVRPVIFTSESEALAFLRSVKPK